MIIGSQYHFALALCSVWIAVDSIRDKTRNGRARMNKHYTLTKQNEMWNYVRICVLQHTQKAWAVGLTSKKNWNDTIILKRNVAAASKMKHLKTLAIKMRQEMAENSMEPVLFFSFAAWKQLDSNGNGIEICRFTTSTLIAKNFSNCQFHFEWEKVCSSSSITFSLAIFHYTSFDIGSCTILLVYGTCIRTHNHGVYPAKPINILKTPTHIWARQQQPNKKSIFFSASVANVERLQNTHERRKMLIIYLLTVRAWHFRFFFAHFYYITKSS